MEEFGKDVLSTDLIDRGYGTARIDFLTSIDGIGRDIITNPPYKFAQEFCERAIKLTGHKVAMFLKLTFLEGQKRKKFFAKYPPRTIYVYSSRRKCALNGEFEKTGSSASAYAWFIWEKGCTSEPVVRWI